MFCLRHVVQQWCFAVFLLCSPVPHFGRPIDALSNRMKRSVTHAQLMHDKGRVLQDFKRRMWLQELLDEVHTAEIRELPSRSANSATGGGASSGAGVVVAIPGIHLSTTGSTMHSKPPGGTKNLPINFRLDEEEGTNLPQETNKSQQNYNKENGGVSKAHLSTTDGGVSKAQGKEGKKKKKGRSGKRRDGEKRRRRARSPEAEPGSGFGGALLSDRSMSVNGLNPANGIRGIGLRWKALLGLQRAQL